MGRIKTTLVKRTSKKLLEQEPELFEKDFEKNKKILGKTMPSKRLRNKIAGYITRLKKNTKNIIKDSEKENSETK